MRLETIRLETLLERCAGFGCGYPSSGWCDLHPRPFPTAPHGSAPHAHTPVQAAKETLLLCYCRNYERRPPPPLSMCEKVIYRTDCCTNMRRPWCDQSVAPHRSHPYLHVPATTCTLLSRGLHSGDFMQVDTSLLSESTVRVQSPYVHIM